MLLSCICVLTIIKYTDMLCYVPKKLNITFMHVFMGLRYTEIIHNHNHTHIYIAPLRGGAESYILIVNLLKNNFVYRTMFSDINFANRFFHDFILFISFHITIAYNSACRLSVHAFGTRQRRRRHCVFGLSVRHVCPFVRPDRSCYHDI